MACRNEFFGFDGRAFLIKFAGVGGHGTGLNSADIGVMGAGGDIEDDVVVGIECGGDGGDVR